MQVLVPHFPETWSKFKRILVIGCPGAGKSTFAEILSKKLGLPLFSLDDLYWLEGWKRPAAEDWNQLLQDLIEKDSWIIDGNYASCLAPRLEKAQLVIFFDFTTSVCFRSVIKRDIRRLMGDFSSLPLKVKQSKRVFRSAPDPLRFWFFVLNFRNHTRREIMGLLDAAGIPVLILKKRKAVSNLLMTIDSQNQ